MNKPPELPDFEILKSFTPVEREVIENAIEKTQSKEQLTIVEEVMLREYKVKLQARKDREELARKVQERNEGNGGLV